MSESRGWQSHVRLFGLDRPARCSNIRTCIAPTRARIPRWDGENTSRVSGAIRAVAVAGDVQPIRSMIEVNLMCACRWKRPVLHLVEFRQTSNQDHRRVPNCDENSGANDIRHAPPWSPGEVDLPSPACFVATGNDAIPAAGCRAAWPHAVS